MREPFRVIQYAGHPEMIESALRLGRIDCMECDGNRTAGIVERCDFGFPKIIRLHPPIQLYRFHNQRGKFRHPGADLRLTVPDPSG